MRWAARADENQPAIVKALRQYGCSVCALHRLGKGVPDILVGYRGTNVLLELKDGDKPPSGRKLSLDEQDFAAGWRGLMYVVKSPMEAIECVKRATKER